MKCKQLRRTILIISTAFALVGCVKKQEASTESPETVTETETESLTESETESNGEPSTEPSTEVYVHGTDGYYCILDDMDIPLESQKGGTCWLYSASCAMETNYYKKTGTFIDIDPYRLLTLVYEDNTEGYVFEEGINIKDFGGWQEIVAMELSRGFDGLTLDRTERIDNRDFEAIKTYLREKGALSTTVPDAKSYRRDFHGYFTMNQVTDNASFYDHDITILGYDDHFPKDYFLEPASQDGAWITYNSMFAGRLYYVSYDTALFSVNGHSITDKYKEVLSYDAGMSLADLPDMYFGAPERASIFGSGIKMANVFHASGKLGAVGTCSLAPDQDVTIEIYDANLKNVLYTQKVHFDRIGYFVTELDQPLLVEDFAVAITYGYDAPVEAKEWEDWEICFRTSIRKGESFAYKDGTWYDMAEEKTGKALGVEEALGNVCIKALMVELYYDAQSPSSLGRG